MICLRHFTFLGAVAACLRLAVGQTIIVNGTQIPATNETVAPAGQNIANQADAVSSFQLTDAVLSNLTALQLSNVSLFYFGNATTTKRSLTTASGSCKTTPGDAFWPTDEVWNTLNILTGGALIKTVPLGAYCYKNNEYYNADYCQYILDNWYTGSIHAFDPTSVDSPLYQGETCLPQNGDNGTCTLGGFPSYVVNVTNVAQIQLAVNFARALDIRLVVKNTGHDFLGKSLGAYALSIYTNSLQDIQFLPEYQTSSYSGPAMRMGPGVNVTTMYKTAHKYGVTMAGAECGGVGVAGGYATGGGHNPIIGKVGLAADQILSVDIVTPDGHFITCDEDNNSDLFWAIRGGGGTTWGVTTSMTFRAYPKTSFAGLKWEIISGNDVHNSVEMFQNATNAYWRRFPEYADNATYAYSFIFPRGPPSGGYTFSMLPWIVPNMTLSAFKAMVAPLFAEWDAIGYNYSVEWIETDNFYDMWANNFPPDTTDDPQLRTGNRLITRENWANETILNTTLSTLWWLLNNTGLVQYNMNGAQHNTPSNAVNPAWRDTVMYQIIGATWTGPVLGADSEKENKLLTRSWITGLMEMSPNGGGYLNEGDVMQPDFQQAFYGSAYSRLLQIKNDIDPWGLFWAPTAVGSENFFVAGVPTWLTLEDGKLCRNLTS